MKNSAVFLLTLSVMLMDVPFLKAWANNTSFRIKNKENNFVSWNSSITLSYKEYITFIENIMYVIKVEATFKVQANQS